MADAVGLVADVDLDDVAFVALANHIDGLLWTGDKVLIDGLKRKQYRNVVSTPDLQLLLNAGND